MPLELEYRFPVASHENNFTSFGHPNIFVKPLSAFRAGHSDHSRMFAARSVDVKIHASR
jgi:hypothetical protein